MIIAVEYEKTYYTGLDPNIQINRWILWLSQRMIT